MVIEGDKQFTSPPVGFELVSSRFNVPAPVLLDLLAFRLSKFTNFVAAEHLEARDAFEDFVDFLTIVHDSSPSADGQR